MITDRFTLGIFDRMLIMTQDLSPVIISPYEFIRNMACVWINGTIEEPLFAGEGGIRFTRAGSITRKVKRFLAEFAYERPVGILEGEFSFTFPEGNFNYQLNKISQVI